MRLSDYAATGHYLHGDSYIGSAISPGHTSTADEAARADASTARHGGRVRVLGEVAGHECVVGVMGTDVYDRDGHGTWYLCRYVSDADALSRWRGWLRSQGVDA